MARRNENQVSVTNAQVTQFKALMPLLEAMVVEFKELSKKKSEGVLNKRKVDLVNRLLKDVLIILDNEPTRPYLDLLDEDDLPQNSDVILTLSQFEAGMKAFKSRYYVYNEALYRDAWTIAREN